MLHLHKNVSIFFHALVTVYT